MSELCAFNVAVVVVTTICIPLLAYQAVGCTWIIANCSVKKGKPWRSCLVMIRKSLTMIRGWHLPEHLLMPRRPEQSEVRSFKDFALMHYKDPLSSLYKSHRAY